VIAAQLREVADWVNAKSAPESFPVLSVVALKSEAALAEPPMIGAAVISAFTVIVSSAAEPAGRYTLTGT
jgi:hypothetical protein